jgi:DNA repair protein RadD
VTTPLRPYQAALRDGVYSQWQHVRNVLAVAPTGAGKTVLFSNILSDYPGASVAIAHRAELVSQISLALARNGVRHGIVAPTATCRNVVAIHMAELGRSWYDPGARCRVAGVDSLPKLVGDPWSAQVGLWIQDEAHHVLKDNKWGRAVAMFPNAHGLGVTATPLRADGKGLGSHADGVFDAMVVGPTMRELIADGYLTDYRVFAPPSTLHREDIAVTAGGDFDRTQLREATRRSTVLGDVVTHYLRIAPGKLGVTFADSIENATDIASRFRASGVPAEVLTGKTPDALRIAILRRFRAREVLQLVNVALLDEGFDCPAIEVVSDASATESYGRYAQRFGRMLRLLEGKRFGIYVDHVGNVVRHGLPDKARVWSLDRRERRSNGGSTIPLRICPQCTQPYERVHVSCPWCGHMPEPAGRASPAQVDGDLCELSPEVLARMRGEVSALDAAPRFPQGLSELAYAGIRNRHLERQQAQHALRETMALWGGVGARPADVRRAQREFFHTFGIDVMSAQALGRPEAEALEQRVRGNLL